MHLRGIYTDSSYDIKKIELASIIFILIFRPQMLQELPYNDKIGTSPHGSVAKSISQTPTLSSKYV